VHNFAVQSTFVKIIHSEIMYFTPSGSLTSCNPSFWRLMHSFSDASND